MKQSGIIIGGGIGGLLTAIALTQRGIQSTVFERAAVLQEVGAGLVLSPNALFVLDQLGLLQALEPISWPLSGGIMAEANGRVFQKVDTLNTHAMVRKYGYGVVVVNRGKLQKLLLDNLQPGQLKTGKQLANVTHDGQQVRADFLDGTSVDGSFLIGADGLRSTVRQQLIGDQPLRYSGQTCWRTIVNYVLPASDQTTAVEYWGSDPGMRIGVVPCGLDQLYLYITVAASANERDTPDQTMASLLRIGEHFSPLARDIIQATDKSRLHRADLYDLPTLHTWTRGRSTLLGDAAHATTPNIGQGACQAIEDAWVVANCLANERSVEEAFKQYESIRKAKADRVVKLSRQIGQAVNLPGWLKPLAFAAMRAMPPAAAAWQFDGIYSMDYVRKRFPSVSQSLPTPAE